MLPGPEDSIVTTYQEHQPMAQQSLSRDFVTFLKNEKKWWMIPLAVVVLLVVGLVLLTRSTAAGPFLYPTL